MNVLVHVLKERVEVYLKPGLHLLQSRDRIYEVGRRLLGNINRFHKGGAVVPSEPRSAEWAAPRRVGFRSDL